MKLVEPSVSILPQESTLEGIYRQIEAAGRTCYKSEEKIKDGSAKPFVDMLIKRGHTAMLEHGTVYLSISGLTPETVRVINRYRDNKYSEVLVLSNILDGFHGYVTTNYRVIVENHWFDDLQFISEAHPRHEKRISVRFICDRGVSHEFVRHRVFSFAQESTRFCNYSNDKFGKELTFIIPNWLIFSEGSYLMLEDNGIFDTPDGIVPFNTLNKESLIYLASLQESEIRYNELSNLGWQPQRARSVLPNSLKTELVMTGTESEWEGFFVLRRAAAAHPQARQLADMLFIEFNKEAK